MQPKRISIAAMIILLSIGTSFSQRTTKAWNIREGSISLDGKLNEICWRYHPKEKMGPNVGLQLMNGSATGPGDCSAVFVLLWDDSALYCGSWVYDDIHNTPWSGQLGTVRHAWKDDGHEWWISFDFNDVWEDTSPFYFGSNGWKIHKGFAWDEGEPQDWYCSYQNDAGTISITETAMRTKGFRAPYWSADGINFQCEARFDWDGAFLNGMGTPSVEKEIGFNLGVCDNDGGDMGSAWLRWAEGSSSNYQGWGKAVLSGMFPSAASVDRIEFFAHSGNPEGRTPLPDSITVAYDSTFTIYAKAYGEGGWVGYENQDTVLCLWGVYGFGMGGTEISDRGLTKFEYKPWDFGSGSIYAIHPPSGKSDTLHVSVVRGRPVSFAMEDKPYGRGKPIDTLQIGFCDYRTRMVYAVLRDSAGKYAGSIPCSWLEQPSRLLYALSLGVSPIRSFHSVLSSPFPNNGEIQLVASPVADTILNYRAQPDTIVAVWGSPAKLQIRDSEGFVCTRKRVQLGDIERFHVSGTGNSCDRWYRVPVAWKLMNLQTRHSKDIASISTSSYSLFPADTGQGMLIAQFYQGGEPVLSDTVMIHVFGQTGLISARVDEKVKTGIRNHRVRNGILEAEIGLRSKGRFELRLVDILGRTNTGRVIKAPEPGVYRVLLPLRNTSSGLGILQLRAGGYRYTRKVLIKR